jgi:hypothetical protein
MSSKDAIDRRTAKTQPKSLRPIAGASKDCGLVVRQSDFMEALEAPDVRETLARAQEILHSPEFPPEELGHSQL